MIDEIKRQYEMNAQQPRFTEDEVRELKAMFKDNDYRLKLMRKFFLPPMDYNAPMGFLQDIYGMIQADNMPDQQAANLVRSRNLMVNHMNRMFIELQSIANTKEETPAEKKVRLQKDSAR
jgi:hypothetical protein